MSSPLPKVVGFSLMLALMFTLVANMLPQVEGEAPVEEEIDLGALTMDSFVSMGETLFMGKGTCTLCHKPPPLGRAPDIQGENMVGLAEERLADSRYQGNSQDAEAYIRESMVDPGAYVVAGWGQAGSNDTVSPMPAVDKAPIELNDVEIDAIIAWLQSKDGNEITVSLPSVAPEVEVVDATVAGAAPAAATTGEEVLSKYGCQACHTLMGTSSMIGPPLDDVGTRMTAEELRLSILEPGAVLAEGFADIMPADFASQMTVSELDLLLDFLQAQQGGQ